jgi:hypothetical protein
MPRFPKGSQEAKDYMASIREKRGSGVSGSKEEDEKKPLIARPSQLKDTEDVRQQLHSNRYSIGSEIQKALKEKKISKADNDYLLAVLEESYISGDKDVNKIAKNQNDAFMGLMELIAKKGNGMGSCSGGSVVSGNPSGPSGPPPPPPPPPPRPSLTPISIPVNTDQSIINDIEEALMASNLAQDERERLLAYLKRLKDRISGNPQSGSGIIPVFKKPKEKVMVAKQPSQADLDYIRVLNELAEFDKGVKEAQERKAKIEKQGGISKAVVAQMMSKITPEMLVEQQRRLSAREGLLDPEGKTKRKRAKEQAEEKRRLEEKRKADKEVNDALSAKGARDVMESLMAARRGAGMCGKGQGRSDKIVPMNTFVEPIAYDDRVGSTERIPSASAVASVASAAEATSYPVSQDARRRRLKDLEKEFKQRLDAKKNTEDRMANNERFSMGEDSARTLLLEEERLERINEDIENLTEQINELLAELDPGAVVASLVRRGRGIIKPLPKGFKGSGSVRF